MTKIVTFGPYDQRTYEQIERCAGPDGYGVLCADNHLGYSQPIGGAVAYENHISPSGVGYDIGCGVKGVRTDIYASEIMVDLPRIMDEIEARVTFGMGGPNHEPQDHPVLDRILHDGPLPEIRQLHQKARSQLGTVGGGNHYVDILVERMTERVWVATHFGSRGFGHTIASGFLSLAAGVDFSTRVPEGSMDAPPVLLDTRTDLGQSYITAMELAADYAYAGRDQVVDRVLGILGARAVETVHNHHNMAWRETHFGTPYWVVRKGCTPAWPGQRGFVGGSMGDISVILSGRDTEENAEALFSTVHGAGRQMSRTEAKGKVKRRKRFRNNVRDDDTLYETEAAALAVPGASKAQKQWVEDVKSVGRIDWPEVKRNLRIELRGADADEAPGAYKDLRTVLGYHEATVDVLKVLDPVGVAMAGPHVPRDD